MGTLKKIVSGIKAVAPTVANLVLPGAGTLLEGLMRDVTGDTQSDLEVVAAKIEADPKLYAELQKKALEQEVSLARIEADKLAIVNATMQAEAKSEKWPQYTWRPFNGFAYPLAVIMIYFLLPLLDKAVPDVPQWIWLGWLSILGVATWDRGKEKRAKTGEQKTGFLAGAINAIREGKS